MRLCIRADANEIIAAGHVVRCASVADSLQNMGVTCCFVTADHGADKLLAGRGFEHFILNSRWEDKQSELAELMALLHNWNADAVLVDSYEAGEDYLRALQKDYKVICFASKYELAFIPDLMINYSQFQRRRQLEQRYAKLPMKGRLLQGAEYAPLRKQFETVGGHTPQRLQKILITTGGSDRTEFVTKLIDACARTKDLEDIEYTVVAGAFCKNSAGLQHVAENNPHVKILYRVENMAECMAEHDAAVTAAGTTMFELCACGTPAISVAIADNQLTGAAYFDEQKIISYAGDIRESEEAAVENVKAQLVCWKSYPEELRKQAEKVRQFIDGKGAERIAKAICEMLCV